MNDFQAFIRYDQTILNPDFPLSSECPDCDGKGQLYDHEEDSFFDCLACEGIGEIEKRFPMFI